MKRHSLVTSRMVIGALLTVSLFLGMTGVSVADIPARERGITSAQNFINDDDNSVNIDTPLETQTVQLENIPDVTASLRAVDSVKKVGPVMSAIYKSKTKRLNYETRSGVALDWDKAQVYKQNRQWIVDVPFTSGMESVSKVLFFGERNDVHTQEIYAQFDNENQAHVFAWNDGVAAIDTVILGTGDETESPMYETRGMNWGKLNNCLSRHGISSWTIGVISVVCGVACVTVVACNACFFGISVGYGSLLGYCLPEAWS